MNRTQLEGSSDDRIAALERDVQSLRTMVGRSRPLAQPLPRVTRLARTKSERGESPGDRVYPALEANPNCYPIVFLDGEFDEEAGQKTLTKTDRNAEPVAFVYSIWEIDGIFEWIPEGTVLNVWFERERWWTDWSPDRGHVLLITGERDEDGYYPGVVQRRNGSDWETIGACKVLDLNE